MTLNRYGTADSAKEVERRFSVDVRDIARAVFNNESERALESLLKPVGTYYVRCNTHKISPRNLAERLRSKGLKVEQNSMIEEALGIRVDGPYNIAENARKIVVDKLTAESVLQGAHVYSPGIIECGSMRYGDAVTVLSELGDVVASGRVLMSANDVLTFRHGLAVRIEQRRYHAPQVRELPEFTEGLLYPQSLASMTTTRVLDPQPTDIVADMNCAPGGKLSHISQLMHNTGRVIGFDRNSEKIKQTRQTLANLECANVTVSIHDSRYLHDDFPNIKADRVLIDPPCSALGLRPKVYDFTTLQRVQNLADYQKQFVRAGGKLVRPGGVIVYSVCTFTREECEQVVEFAERECGLHVVEQKPFIGAKGFGAFGAPESLTQRFHPHLHEIGYFIAKFQR